MITKILPANDPHAIAEALKLIRAGELVAFPTDTVYGLGASAFSAPAIEQLFTVKGREAGKAIAVLLGNPGALSQVTSAMGPQAAKLAQRYWPGPLTLVVPIHPALPANLSPRPTIGVRMPDHRSTLTLLNRSGPLAVTSANLSGGPNTTTAYQVLAQLGGRIPLILDGGETPGGLPSTVVDCTAENSGAGGQPQILRPGPISMGQILEALR